MRYDVSKLLQTPAHVLAEVDAQNPPIAFGQHLKVPPRLRGLDHAERVLLPGYRQVVSVTGTR